MLGIIGQLIGGLIVGVLARLLLPGKENFPEGVVGWLLTAVLGIGGAFLGGTVARMLWRSGDENYAASWTMSLGPSCSCSS